MEKAYKNSFINYIKNAFDVALTRQYPSTFNSENMLFNLTEEHQKLLNIFNNEFDFEQFIENYEKYFNKFKETYSVKSGNDLAFFYIQSNDIADLLVELSMITKGSINENTTESIFAEIIKNLNYRLFNSQIDDKYFSSGLERILSTEDDIIDKFTTFINNPNIDTTVGEEILENSDSGSIDYIYKFLDIIFQKYSLLYKHFAGIIISHEELIKNQKDKTIGIEYIMEQNRKIHDLNLKLENKKVVKEAPGKTAKYPTKEKLFLATKNIENFKTLSGNQIAKKLGYANKSSLNSLCDSLEVKRNYFKSL